MSRPVLLIGMHRSGTSLTARLLMQCGLFMGSHLSVNDESIDLRKYNDALLRRAKARWSMPGEFISRVGSADYRRTEADWLQRALINRGHIRSFFRFEDWRDIQTTVPRWGFKDPRTTLTFQIWRQVFPDARIVSVIRNGVDVALSLHHRAQANRSWWKWVLPRYNLSARMLDLEECFRLWEEYVGFEQQAIAQEPNVLVIRYDDLLARPIAELRRVVEHIELEVDNDRLCEVCAEVNPTRLDNRDRWHPHTDTIRRLVLSPLLEELGYAAKMRELLDS